MESKPNEFNPNENPDVEEYSSEENYSADEYTIWKKNSPYLYDVLMTFGLDWPSLTINWIPNIDIPQKSNFCQQKMVLGTHTSGQEPESLIIAKTRILIHLSSFDLLYFHQKFYLLKIH